MMRVNPPGQIEITEALDNLLASPYFRQSRKLAAFLRFVVEKTMRGETHEIKEYTIGVEILNRKERFNPQQDASVRIHALRLRNVLDLYYSREGAEDPVVIQIPKGQYAAEFRYATVGYDSETEEDPKHILESVTPNKPILAVLPFTCYADAGCEEQLSDELCIRLCAELSMYEDINVRSFYSTSVFSSNIEDLKRVREEMGVSHILVGSLHRYDHSVMISYELIDAFDFRILWAASMEQKMNGRRVSEEQGDIVHHIASKLAGYGGVILRKREVDGESPENSTQRYFDAVYWFYHFHIRNTEDIFWRTHHLLKDAINRYPSYAIGYATYAHLLMDGIMYGFVAPEESFDPAMESARKAVALDPKCQHGHMAIAWGRLIQGDVDDFRSEIENCVAINPHAPFFLRAAEFGYVLAGDYEKAAYYHHRADALEPVPRWWMNLAVGLAALHRGAPEQALRAFRNIDESGYIFQHILEASVLSRLGQTGEAIKLAQKYQAKYPRGVYIVESSLSTIMRDRKLFDTMVNGFHQAGLNSKIPVEKSLPV